MAPDENAVRTIRGLAESLEGPGIVWSDEPVDLLTRVFSPDDFRNRNLSIRWLNGLRMRSESGIWDEFSAALQFPLWFGRNWDALDECLTDLDWESRRAYVLLITNAESLLVDEPTNIGVLFSVLGHVRERLTTEYQQSFDQIRPTAPFHVVLHTTPTATLSLQQRLDACGIAIERRPVRNTASWE